MKKESKDRIKKSWHKPAVHTLSIKKDTFSGSGLGAEDGTKRPSYVPKDPSPR